MKNIPKPHVTLLYKKWWTWTILVILLIIFFILLSTRSAMEKKKIAEYAYLTEAVSVDYRDIEHTISTTGTLYPEEWTSLTAVGPGTVIEVNKKSGDLVFKDDLIMKIDLIGGGTQEIKAPFDGRVIAITGFPGGEATPGMTGVEVGYQSSSISFLASDSEVIDLEEGQDVTVTVPSYDNGKEEFTEKVRSVSIKKEALSISPAVVPEIGYVVTVSANNLPEKIVDIVGLSVDLEITTKESKDTLSVLSGAIQYNEYDEPFVYIVPTITKAFIEQAKKENTVTNLLETRAVEIGFEGDEYTEITGGIESGENVLLYVPSDTTSAASF